MTLTDDALDAIATRLDSWVRFGTPEPAEGDVTALLTEVRLMRRVHRTDVELLNTCREQLASVYDDYRDLADTLGAIDDQDRAAEGDLYREPGQ